MRTIIFIISILLLTVNKSFSQNSLNKNVSPIFSEASKGILRNIEIPYDVLHDSCYNNLSFILFTFNSKGEIGSLKISDNSPLWLKSELSKIIQKKRIDYAAINKIGKKEKLANSQVVFPFIISALSYEPSKCPLNCSGVNDLLYFDDKKLKGKIIMEENLYIYFSKPRT